MTSFPKVLNSLGNSLDMSISRRSNRVLRVCTVFPLTLSEKCFEKKPWLFTNELCGSVCLTNKKSYVLQKCSAGTVLMIKFQILAPQCTAGGDGVPWQHCQLGNVMLVELTYGKDCTYI